MLFHCVVIINHSQKEIDNQSSLCDTHCKILYFKNMQGTIKSNSNTNRTLFKMKLIKYRCMLSIMTYFITKSRNEELSCNIVIFTKDKCLR